MDGGAWWAAVHRVAKSRTRLKRLSSSSRAVAQQTQIQDVLELCAAGPQVGGDYKVRHLQGYVNCLSRIRIGTDEK